jgi:hypothetical protein
MLPMRGLTSGVCVIVMTMAFVAMAGEPAPSGLKPDADGWIHLFDGKDLSAWQKPAADKWKVVDGILTFEKGCGNIWTKDKFGDFVLDLEVKCATGTNSGLFLRSAEGEKNWLNGSFEIQVSDAVGGKRTTDKHELGALYDCVAPSAAVGKPLGEWNHYVVTFKGNSLKVVLNDTPVLDVDLDKFTEAGKSADGTKNKFKTAYKDMAKVGYFGLQDHGTPVWYRNIKIKPLSDAK